MVTLRPLSISDAPAVAAAADQSRDSLRRWMPWYRDDYDVAAASQWIQESLAGVAAGTVAQFAILSGDDFAGVIGFEGLNEPAGRAMIGYWLAAPAAGRGIGRRAIELALEWAAAQPSLRVIWAVVADVNHASRRVLELNQFNLVGTGAVDERGDTALLYEHALFRAET